MAGFEVYTDGDWRKVAPLTRRQVIWKDYPLFVPDLGELADLTRSFGRPKDLARARTLDALISGAPLLRASFKKASSIRATVESTRRP